MPEESAVEDAFETETQALYDKFTDVADGHDWAAIGAASQILVIAALIHTGRDIDGFMTRTKQLYKQVMAETVAAALAEESNKEDA